MKLKQLALVAALFAAQTAFAADVYLGAGLGQSRATIDNQGIPASTDYKDRGGKVLAGVQLNRYFGVEASYFDLGDFRATSPVYSLSRDTSVKGGALDLVGTLPVTERFGILGRVGAARTRVNEFGSATVGNVSYSDSGKNTSTNLKAGLGLQYKFTEALAGRVEYERYRMKDVFDNRGHVNLVSAGLVYNFGAKPKTVAYVAPAPAPVAAPTPAPVYVAPAVVETPAPTPTPEVTTVTKKVRE